MSVLLDPQRSASTRRNTRHLPYMFIVKVRTWNSFLLKIHEWLHWRGLEKLNKIKQVHFHRLAEFQTLHNSVYPCECRFDLLKVIMSAIHLWIWLDDCKRDDRISTMLEHFAQKIIYLESVFLSFFFFFRASAECVLPDDPLTLWASRIAPVPPSVAVPPQRRDHKKRHMLWPSASLYLSRWCRSRTLFISGTDY